MARPADDRRRSACTLIELLFFLAFLATGIIAAGAVARGLLGEWARGRWWAVLGTFIVGFFAIPAILVPVAWIDHRRRPSLPRCRTGRCPGWNFDCLQIFKTRYLDDTRPRASLYRCACGVDHILLDDRLLTAGEDGLWHPYMKRVYRMVPLGGGREGRQVVLGYAGWTPDTDGGPPLEPDVRQVVWEKGSPSPQVSAEGSG